MTITGIVESAIYVDDVSRSVDFYTRVFGFEVEIQDERIGALRVVPGQVFLIFKRGATIEPVQLPGGMLPGHDGHGQMHFAFGIPVDDFNLWQGRLRTLDVAVESILEWPRGGKSIYFRDPDAHLVELITPGVWTNY